MITYGSTTLTSYNSIVKTEVYYYKSTSATSLLGGSWATTKPTWENGKYIWQKIRTVYEDGTHSESDPVNITGQQGATGTAAYSFKLNSSDSIIGKTKDGEYTIKKITFSATYKQGTGAVSAYNGRFKIESTTNGSTWKTEYTSSGNESSKAFTIPNDIIAIKCSLYQSGGTTVLLDIVTVPVVKDGVDAIGLRDSIPYYLASDKDTGITKLTQGWTRYRPQLTAEKKYLWVYYVSRYSEGSTEPELIEIKDDLIHFENNGDESPVESCVVDIEPVQDLHGYDSPWPAGGGVNKLLPRTSDISGTTSYGITFSYSVETETLTMSGTNSDNSAHIFFSIASSYFIAPEDLKVGDSFWFAGIVPTGAYAQIVYRRKDTGVPTNLTYIAGTGQFRAVSGVIPDNFDGIVRVDVGVNASKTVSGTAKLMLSLESSAPTEWTSYSNICPITGWTGEKVTRTGKNLLWKARQSSTMNGITWTLNDDGSITASGTSTGRSYIRVLISDMDFYTLPKGTYTYSLTPTGSDYANIKSLIGSYKGTKYYKNVCFVSISNHFANKFTWNDSDLTATLDIVIEVADANKTVNCTVYPQIELGSTATEYEPYQGDTYDIAFPSEAGTVYGGTLDVTSGVLTVDRAILAYNTANMNNYEDYPGWRDAKVADIVGTGIITSFPNVVTNVGFGVGINTRNSNSIIYMPKIYYNNLTQSDWIALAIDIQILLQFATPITYTLTPQEITMLCKENNIFADTGQTAISYYDNQTSTDPYVDYSLTSAFDASTIEPAYIETEWVESTGKQYVYLDWKPPIKTWGFEIDFISYNALGTTAGAWNEDTNKNGYGTIFGVRNASGVNNAQLCSYSNGLLRIGNGSNQATGFKTNHTRQQIKLQNTTITKADGTTSTVSRLDETANKPYCNMTVFGLHDGLRRASNGGISEPSSTRIYSLKFYDGDTLTVDLVGAIRKRDSVTGLYDKVSKHFYPAPGMLFGDVVGDIGDSISMKEAMDKANPQTIVVNKDRTRMWEATVPFNDLQDGQKITVTYSYGDVVSSVETDELIGWDDTSNNQQVYLKLTFADGHKTDWIPCYYSNTSRLTTHYGAGIPIQLTYRENILANASETASGNMVLRGFYADANYDTNNTDIVRWSYGRVIAGSNKIFPYSIIMQNADERWESIVTSSTTAKTKTRNTHGFRLDTILYQAANTTTNENVENTSYQLRTGDPIMDMRYNLNIEDTAELRLVHGKSVYLVGTVGTDGLFYLDDHWWSQSLPTTEDGKIYIFLGQVYDWYRCGLATMHPIYKFVDGKLKSTLQIAVDALDKAKEVAQDLADLGTDLQAQIDGKIETWCQQTDPSTAWTTTELKNQHNGDLWYYIGESNTTYKNNTTYKYTASTGKWTAYSASTDLFDRIDSKSTVYYGKPSAITQNLEVGDYLVDNTDGCSYRWDGSKWVKVTDYKTTITNAIDNIQIGGRNLALDSSLTGNIQKWNPTVNRWTKTIKDGHECLMCEGSLNTTATLTVPLTINSGSYGVIPYNGLQLVFSADVLLEDVVKGTTNFYLALYGSGQTIDGQWHGATLVKNSPHMTDSSIIPNELNGIGWTRVWYIFKYDDYNWSAYLRPAFYARDFTGKVYVKNIKVEYGDYATDWTPAPEDVTSSIQTYVDTLQFQVDHMAEIYYGTAVPTLSNTPASDWNTNDIKDIHVDDLYYNTSTGYCYRFTKSGSTYSWTRIKDSDITAAATAASNANTVAGNAQTTANNANTLAGQKRRIFVAQPTPPYEIGDLWVGGSNGDIKKCKTARATGNYTASDWELASKYTDDTLANEANDKIDNLEIGGRNYKQNSNFSNKLNKWSSWNGATVTIDENIENKNWAHVTMGTDKAYGGFSWALGKKTNADPMPIISGNEITIAFDAQLIEGEGNAILWLHYRSTEVGTNLVQATQRFSLTEKTSRFSHTFVIPSHSTNTIDTIGVMIGIVDGTIKQARFTNIKVEKGNRATDWSPAPEDITRGTGFYAITTVPSAYTTTTGGFTPAYRIDLSTVKTESGLEKVMIGDVIQQGYNTYPVGYVDASYVYLGSANSIRGATGATGLNNAQVILYRRFASAPSGTDIAPTGDVTYTFATGKAVNNLNSWTQNIPTGSNPVYMIAASASNTSATDVIPKTEWSAPVKILENGQNGGTGSAGADGYNQATIFLYQRKSGTAPSKPSSAVTYTFSSGALSSTPTGWSRTIPINNGNPCYVTTATAVAKTATYSIPANGWSDVVILSQDGEDGTSITITSTSVKYQKGTSGTTAPTGTWGTSIPTVGENEFLWTQTIVNYSDNSKTESYSVSRNAKNGTNGTSPTVSSTTVEYQQSTGGTTPPTGTWNTTAPTATAGQYMWTRTTITYSDSKTAVSYSVSKNGTDGTSPTAYHLIVSHGAINKSQAGVYNPTTITLTSKYQTGNGALNNYSGRFKIETTTDNNTWTQDSASSTANESSKTYTIPANIKAVRFSLYLAGGFTTLLDQQTVPVVTDGAKGDNGEDAYTIVLTNEAHTFPAGVSAALAGSATSNVMTYKGGVQVACFVGSTFSATSISTGTTGLTCTINNNNSKNVSLTFTATTSLTTKAGTVIIPITVDNKSFSKTFTWSLANQGIKGDDGVSVTNVTSTNNTADGGTSVVTVTLSNGTTKTFNVKNGSKGNTGATAQWYYGTSLTHTSGTATLVATSTSGAVVGSMYLNTQTSLVYKCTAVGTNNTWTYAGDLTTGVIDNIEIGGRNLLCNSNQSLTTVSTKGDFYLSETIPTDTTIVVSVQIDADDITWASSGNRRIGFEMSQVTDGISSGTQYAGAWWTYPKTTFHGRVWNKVKLTRDFPAIIKRYGLYVQGVTGGTYKVSKPKVEIATKPTDWSPAPEDTDASIQQVQDNLDNLEIGGRNLLKGTRTQDVSYGNYQNAVTVTNDTFLGCTVFKSSTAWADIGFNLRTQIINKNLVKAGDILTYSVWAKTDDTENRDMYGIWVGNYIGGSKIGKITSEWQQYYKTFEITQAMIDGTDTIPTRFECNTACTSGKYIYWAAPKLERGSKATDWTPAPEDTQADIDTALAQSVEYIIGTQTAITGTWTGRTVDKELKVGKTIAYKLPYAGSGNASLVLTLADNTTTDAIAVYLNTTRVTTHFGAGSVINMTYDGYYWRITSIPNSDTVVNVIPYFSGKTGTLGIWRYSLFMRDGNGTYQNICTASDGTVTTTNSTIETTKKANPNGFEVGSSIWYANGAGYNANTNISDYNVIYSSTTVIDSRYSLNTERKANSLTPYLPIYLIGEIKSDNLFYLDTVWWTQTPTDSSKVYVLIGGCYDSTTSNVRIALYENNGWYKYVNGKLEDYSNRLAELASTTATAYITDTTDNGIMVHPENDTTSGWSIASAIQLFKSGISYIKLWIENNVAKIRIGREDKGHVLIDNDSVDIKNGENVLASFGESTYIGRNNGYHMLISPNDFIGISDSNAEYFKISGYVSTKTLSSNETITETTGYRTGRYFSYRLLNTPLDSSTVSVQEVFYDENYTELNARHFEQVYHYEAPSSDPDTTTWKWEENISEIPAGVGNRPQQQLIIDEELFDQENGLEIGVHFSEASVKYVVFRVTYKPANSTVAVVNPYYTFGYRKDDYNVGVYSFAEGANIIASGEHSHAEGENTIASGQGSHAEGAVTTANGDYSHIEGYNGTANGDLSHVEGEACVANGSTSHAQGVGTIADSDAQMVLGRLNMPDSSNKYAVIVGNGDINRRSDAFRLTWDGDLLFFYQNNNPSQGTLDYDLKQAIDALNWGGDIIVG